MTKIVQTFWNASKDDILLNTGGYICPEIHWMSWAFSCLQLRKFYSRIEMYTNNAGKELFEMLEIPYTKIHTTLENNEFMENLMPELWAYSKIHTYSIQEEPFLHIDGDVFIWKPFEEKLVNSPLVAQNLEDNMEIYTQMLKLLEKYLDYKPDWLQYLQEHPKAYNAGIIGGTDYIFFKEYAQITYDFYKKNKNSFEKLKASGGNINAVNLIFEQYLYYVLAKKKDILVHPLTDKVIRYQSENEYFTDIKRIPFDMQYLHTLGHTKKLIYINNFISYIFSAEYPEYWHKIISIFEKRNILSPYMTHLLQSKNKNKKNIIINPALSNNKKNERTEDLLQESEPSVKNICKYIKQSFSDIKNIKPELLAKHPVLQEIYDFLNIKDEFYNQDFNKYFIPNTAPFDYYIKKGELFRKGDFLKNYIFVTPYHYIYVTSYNWDSILGTIDEDKLDIYEKQDLMLLYLDINSNIITGNRVVSKFLVDFMENIKLKPTTIGEYIEKKEMNELEVETFINLLKQLQIEGIVYFSNNMDEFIPQPPSEHFLSLLKNYNTQISKSLKFILNHYKITNYDNNKIALLDSAVYQQTASIADVLNLVKELNFNAMALKTKMEFIKDIPIPAILLLEDKIYGDSWYVVLTSVSNEMINVYNPEFDKIVSYSYKSFDELWCKKLIILNP